MQRSSGHPVIGLNMVFQKIKTRMCYTVIDYYIDSILEAGGIPLPVFPSENEQMLPPICDKLDGMLFVGGQDYPPSSYGQSPCAETDLSRLRPEFDLHLMRRILETRIPVLGICAGCQLLAIAHGGRLIQHLPNANEHTDGRTHPARIVKDGWLRRILHPEDGRNEFTVNSFHHQAADFSFPGRGLEISALAFDGSVEALERPGDRMVLGVQFHPERIPDLAGKIFGALVEEARKSC